MEDYEATSVDEVLKRIAAEYGFFGGLAKNNPAIAAKQLQDAMRTCYKHKNDARFDRPENLPLQEKLTIHLAALERLLQRYGDGCSDAEIKTLAQLPGLLCRVPCQVVREDYGSGLEYIAEERRVDAVAYPSVRDLIRQLHSKRFGTPE
jgi:hypothetical protein